MAGRQNSTLKIIPVESEEQLIKRRRVGSQQVLHYAAPDSLRAQFSFAALGLHIAEHMALNPDVGSYSPGELKDIFKESMDPQAKREMDFALERMHGFERAALEPSLFAIWGEVGRRNIHTHSPNLSATCTLFGEDHAETTWLYNVKDIVGGQHVDHRGFDFGNLRPMAQHCFSPKRLDIIKLGAGVWHDSPDYRQKGASPRLVIAGFGGRD